MQIRVTKSWHLTLTRSSRNILKCRIISFIECIFWLHNRIKRSADTQKFDSFQGLCVHNSEVMFSQLTIVCNLHWNFCCVSTAVSLVRHSSLCFIGKQLSLTFNKISSSYRCCGVWSSTMACECKSLNTWVFSSTFSIKSWNSLSSFSSSEFFKWFYFLCFWDLLYTVMT